MTHFLGLPTSELTRRSCRDSVCWGVGLTILCQRFGALRDGRYKTHVSKMASMGGREARAAIKKVDFCGFQC